MDDRKIFLICLLFNSFLNFSLYSQTIISLEDHKICIDDENEDCELPEGLEYVKDISGFLTPYVGDWSGTTADFIYFFKVEKGVGTTSTLKFDELQVRYKVIRRINNVIIENTYNVPEIDNTIHGIGLFDSANTTKYRLYYKETGNCYTEGWIYFKHYIHPLNGEFIKMSFLRLDPSYDLSRCPNGVEDYMPQEPLILSKI